MIKFVKPNEELIKKIAHNMRPADVIEIDASNGHSPIEALFEGWDISDYSVIIVDDDVPLVMFGLVRLNIVTGLGTPWMLSSEEVLKYVKILLPKSKIVVDQMLEVCPKLINYVQCENTISIRWLKWLGFTIEEPLPYGVKGKLFHRFNLERY
jgi:hypothetical protein